MLKRMIIEMMEKIETKLSLSYFIEPFTISKDEVMKLKGYEKKNRKKAGKCELYVNPLFIFSFIGLLFIMMN